MKFISIEKAFFVPDEPLTSFQDMENDDRPAISRGVLLANVLDGQGHVPTLGCYSDLPEGQNPDDIDFDPENASRLDKFDGLEYATERMEGEIEKRHNEKS